MPKKIILVQKGKDDFEAYGSLTHVCNEYPMLKYWSLARLKFPIKSEGLTIHKIKYKQSKNNKNEG